MSLYQNASLVMIPSAVKDGKLYSIRPTDGSGDFTFTRGSNLAATRVDVNGLIEKGRENLLLQSNNFSTSPWQSNQSNREAVVSSGAAGYDGTNDAWLVLDTIGSGLHQIAGETLSLSGIYSASVYAKAYTNSRYLGMAGFGLAGGNEMPVFDLVNGTIDMPSTSSILKDATITSVGNGWYRCSMMFSYSGSSSFSITLCDSATDNSLSGYTYTGTGSNGFYIQDAQLEVGLVATDYIETTTTTAVSGITEDLPRLDYSGSCPSLLLEPQRTNVIDYSEYFDGWIKSNISVANNVSTSPEGVQNAATIDVVSDASFSSLRQVISVSANSTYTMSLFVKKETSETNYMGLGFVYSGGTTDVGYVVIDSVNGTAVSADPRIDVITNVLDFGDYWRIEATATDSGSNTSLSAYIYATLSTNGTSVALGASSTRTIYGAQLESNASYASSYIPTYGSAVTRSKDAMNNSSLGLTDCTFFVDFVPLSSVMGLLDFYDNSNALIFYIAIDAVKYLTFNSVQGGTIGQILGPLTIGDRMKLAFTLNASNGDVTIFINGTKYSTYSTTISSLNKILQVASFGYFNNTKFNQIISFPTILTDSEAIALTTL